MTAALNPAETAPATDRSRRGGRAGKRSSGAASFDQPAFRQLRNPLAPTKLVSEDELESIHLASLRVLKEIGVDVLHDEARRIMKEHGADQYEVTIGPKAGIRFADEAVILREVVRSTALAHDETVTFTPIRDPAGVGNGVHIHMSFLDGDGKPATWDPAGKHELSPVAGQFVAGVLKYLDAITAITAPSVVSYLRLTPHRWSAAFNNLGFRDREASVRICPVSDLSDIAKAAQFNFEFRAADATASPYLQLAAIVHAGVQGIEEGLQVPEATQEDLSLLDPAALAERGYKRLPTTLEEALKRFEANGTVTGWFPQGFADVYVKHKLGEIDHLKGRELKDVCAAYEEVY